MEKYKVLSEVEIAEMPYAPSPDDANPNIIELDPEVAAPFVEAGNLELVEEEAEDEEEEEEDGDEEEETV